MSQDAVTSLEELLKALARERSLRGRLRVLGHSWQLLRGLAPAERETVALRVGSSWAWKRLEKSFLSDGQLDDKERLVGRIFERMGNSDPSELRELASALRSGDHAAGTDLLLMTLKEALEEEASEEEERLEELFEADAAAQLEPELEVEREVEPDREPMLQPASAATAEESPASSLAEPVATAEGSEASTPAAPEPPPAPLPRAIVSPQPQPEPPRQPERVSPARSPSEFEAPRLEVPAGGGLERLRVLRSLQHDPEPGVALGRPGRAELIDSLGAGWASRRALSRMISAGSLDDLDEALGLIARLARPAEQTWCLADLIAASNLDAKSRERVLAAAPSDSARRRLGRRRPRSAMVL